MKNGGVVVSFRGVRVYTRSGVGMPGSETALDELMCPILGDCLEDGIAGKRADDLYCGTAHQLEEDPRWPTKVQYQAFSIYNHYLAHRDAYRMQAHTELLQGHRVRLPIR
ncbi:Hypothetical predicted protein, partial [Paramuricea clavata]